MKTEHKIYAAVGILALLGVLLYWGRSSATPESTASKEKPSFNLKPEDVPNVTKLEFENAEKKEKIVLEKAGETWNITSPIKAKANAKEVEDLLKSLEKLKVSDQIDSGTNAYNEYDVADGKGVKFAAYKGNDKAIDVVFGKSGGRGQTVRVMGRDGVWAVPAAEYKSVLFTKEAKNWRDKAIVEFKDTDVESVEVENIHGKYSFTRDGDNWKGVYEKGPDAPKKEEPKKEGEDAKKEGEDAKKDGDKKDEKKDGDKKSADAKKDGDKKDAKKDGDKKDEKKDEPKKDEPAKNPGWEAFDGKNVETLVGAFKKLNAYDFGDATDTEESTGLKAAVKEGGIVTFKLKGGQTIQFIVGKVQKGKARFAKKADDATIFVLAGHQADWVTAEPAKFEKKAPGAEPEDDGHGHEEVDPEDMMQMPIPEE